MNVARLNFSHGTWKEHEAWVRSVRKISAAQGLPVAILQDLAGPKLRVGEVPGGQVKLRAGKPFILSLLPLSPGDSGVQVDFPEIVAETPPGARILLADGQIELKVESKSAEALHCRISVGGVLRSRVGINFPSHSLSVPALTAKDKEDLKFAVKQEVDYVGLSFVRSPQDVLEAREIIHSQRSLLNTKHAGAQNQCV
jgi:pyruvate kinase